ncbi:phage tail assembly chaperone [Pseudomonas wayambapalatensis]|nr:phage tail assembly chaperone [Pseudomonas wayambapalatensis]
MWALINAGTVKEVTSIDPTGRFHSEMDWHSCHSDVQPGWKFIEGQFTASAASIEVLAEIERSWRDHVLASTQWLMSRHRDELELNGSSTLSAAQYAELLNFRQYLRNWPASTQFPQTAQRPRSPDWLESVS